MSRRLQRQAEAGFSLAETVVAAGLLATVLVSLAQLLAISMQNVASARAGTMAVLLAQQKMEHLRSLTWGFDAAAQPASDVSTDTATGVESPRGGTGLTRSPATALEENTSGWVDYTDARGTRLGGGASPPAGAVFVRRWAIDALPADPDHTLILQVVVMRIASLRQDGGAAAPSSRTPHTARLVSAKSRKTR